jgi:hypothetical protein
LEIHGGKRNPGKGTSRREPLFREGKFRTKKKLFSQFIIVYKLKTPFPAPFGTSLLAVGEKSV